MKQKFSALDIRCLVKDLNAVVGLRCQNIYDIQGSSKHLLFKFTKPNEKVLFVVENGNRCHLTTYSVHEEEKSGFTMPHGFTMKLRKHLRSRRCSAVYQLGADRVISIEFGEEYKLVLEFYASVRLLIR